MVSEQEEIIAGIKKKCSECNSVFKRKFHIENKGICLGCHIREIAYCIAIDNTFS